MRPPAFCPPTASPAPASPSARKVCDSSSSPNGKLTTESMVVPVLGVADDALARTVLELAALLQDQTTDKSACIDSIRFQVCACHGR